mgnify:CR=1 FL=1
MKYSKLVIKKRPKYTKRTIPPRFSEWAKSFSILMIKILEEKATILIDIQNPIRYKKYVNKENEWHPLIIKAMNTRSLLPKQTKKT